MTIRVPLTRVGIFLASLLTDIRGHLLYFVLRFGSVESSVPIATEFTPSSSRDITPVTEFELPSRPLPMNTDSPSNPSEELHNIVTGKRGCDTVSLSEWMELVTMAMVEAQRAELNLDIPYGGGIYSFYHCIKQINPPAPTRPIMEYKN